MAHYIHLSPDERYTISAHIKIGTSLREIASSLGRSASTISREIKRNKGLRGYRPKQACETARKRRNINKSWFNGFATSFILYLIDLKWSPEQIHGALTARGWTDVPSHEWIYQFIYRDKAKGGMSFRHLRCQKTYRKRGCAANDRRGQIPERTSIHDRPELINRRERLGDFEGDLIVGAMHKGAVLTLVDRKSLLLLAAPLAGKQADKVSHECLRLLSGIDAHSVTFDNGKEFSSHIKLQQRGIATYFADPYCSNQRARNENMNGLIRQYLPKKMSFSDLTYEHVLEIQTALNNRPRKTLDWATPLEVSSRFFTVALQH
jgi:transposase, IS30 family